MSDKSSKKLPWKGVGSYPPPNPILLPTRVCSVIDDPQFDENPTEFDHQVDDEHGLYEDKFCKLTSTVLTIKNYYFPSGNCRRIALENVETFAFWDGTNKSVPWGTVDGHVWWSYDFLRCLRTRQDLGYVVNCGEKLAKGFTVRRPEAFIRVLSSICPRLISPGHKPKRRDTIDSTD